MKPKISVILSVYNGERHLRESIESVLNQTFPDFEFIIVNDGSTDSSLRIIKSYDDPRIRIIDNEKNMGLTKSLNKALKKACGEYIARQDADDISMSERFNTQIQYLEENPQVGLLGTSVYVIDEECRILEKRVMAPNPKKMLLKGNRLVHGSVIFRKSVIDEVGVYHETLKYSQDYELWLRISKKFEVRNLSTPLYMLRFHERSISSDNINEQQMCAVLAKKMVFGEIEEKLLLLHEPMDFYDVLSKKDKITFHKAIAYSYAQIGNLPSFRRESHRVFELDPFDLENDIQLLFSLFGLRGVRFIHQFYRYSRHILYKLVKLEI